MSDIAIRVENLGKRYHIGTRARFRTLRDTVTDTFAMAWRKRAPAPNAEWIWALRDVSFEVKQGQAVGIIGKNGAGKSTLLKILARITEPTEGTAQVRGRIGSLLEIGTGFHPELTGRENVFLNGAILGMKRAEIQYQFDEIVTFAEVEKFIDTPVKHYSSGMYLRLAFAVAAHLNPEILLVDEVLAVGDAAFQKRCIGKMGAVTEAGRTVLFISHNMGAIVQLCPTVMLLREGRVETIERADQVVTQYLADDTTSTSDVHFDPASNAQSPAILTRFWVADSTGMPIHTVDVTRNFHLGLQVHVRQPISEVDISIRVRNALGQPVLTTNLSDKSNTLATFQPGVYTFLVDLPNHFLAPDRYSLIVAIHRPGLRLFDMRDRGLSFQIAESGSRMWRYHGQAYGNVIVRWPWRTIARDGENL
jgi:lipopolysaccharide transport system ATP-binding protein